MPLRCDDKRFRVGDGNPDESVIDDDSHDERRRGMHHRVGGELADNLHRRPRGVVRPLGLERDRHETPCRGDTAGRALERLFRLMHVADPINGGRTADRPAGAMYSTERPIDFGVQHS